MKTSRQLLYRQPETAITQYDSQSVIIKDFQIFDMKCILKLSYGMSICFFNAGY